jgi:hypothetical protein
LLEVTLKKSLDEFSVSDFRGIDLTNYRGKRDIIADILFAASSRKPRKTQIMYQANLSFRLLAEVLSLGKPSVIDLF